MAKLSQSERTPSRMHFVLLFLTTCSASCLFKSFKKPGLSNYYRLCEKFYKDRPNRMHLFEERKLMFETIHEQIEITANTEEAFQRNGKMILHREFSKSILIVGCGNLCSSRCFVPHIDH